MAVFSSTFPTEKTQVCQTREIFHFFFLTGVGAGIKPLSYTNRPFSSNQHQGVRIMKSFLYRPQLEALESRLAPATHTWNGSLSKFWADGSNWTGGIPI